ncbi:YkoF family thiamine/hydroxymethylpyrimidine-binding protein [Inediibacterium massiliense]|uniref:YkoF family thiamine/hydroxymethylpyrimidine-binding protein n=1 Tax=Inediibacterium massiliense TaxID=1658111 RepID=UPI0006B4D47D|nr:YkoF family thiamine/hydroxymethylpyrimidine-binding protein [Inediibacterium massiliense]
MIQAEVAVYPIKTSNATNVINNSIHALQANHVNYTVNSMNTKLTGTKAHIFDSLESMFTEAENTGAEVNMVVTITNASE